MGESALFSVVIMAGQVVDGHVHRSYQGGVLAHCPPYLVEIKVGRRPPARNAAPADATNKARAETLTFEAWLYDEKESPVPVRSKTVRARLTGFPEDIALRPTGRHFRGSIDVSDVAYPLSIEVFLTEEGRTSRASVRWRTIDDVSNLDDRKMLRTSPKAGAKPPAPLPSPPPERRLAPGR